MTSFDDFLTGDIRYKLTSKQECRHLLMECERRGALLRRLEDYELGLTHLEWIFEEGEPVLIRCVAGDLRYQYKDCPGSPILPYIIGDGSLFYWR